MQVCVNVMNYNTQAPKFTHSHSSDTAASLFRCPLQTPLHSFHFSHVLIRTLAISLSISRIAFIPADPSNCFFTASCNDNNGDELLLPEACLQFTVQFAVDKAPVGYHSKIMQVSMCEVDPFDPMAEPRASKIKVPIHCDSVHYDSLLVSFC